MYQCNGQPARLEINIYQPIGALNGYAASVAVNVKNVSGCNLIFTEDNPLRLTVDILNNNVLNNPGRSLFTPSTSSGTISYTDYGSMANKPVGTVQRTVEWAFVGSISTNQERDLAIGFGDGSADSSRWNNYMVITPGDASGAPTYDSLNLSNEECREYYDAKMETWVPTVNWVVRDKDNVTTDVPYGSSIDSRVTGNHSSGGANSRDGIW